MTIAIKQGAIAPQAFRMNVTPGDSGLDLSTVSAAYFLVYKIGTDPDRALRWECTLSNQTSSTLLLVHLFGARDTARLGDYKVIAMLVVPGGEIPTDPEPFTIVNRFGD